MLHNQVKIITIEKRNFIENSNCAHRNAGKVWEIQLYVLMREAQMKAEHPEDGVAKQP